jgi:hypothetical protein
MSSDYSRATDLHPSSSSSQVRVEAKSGIKVIAELSRVAPGGLVTVTFWGATTSSTRGRGMHGITRPDKFRIPEDL